MKEYTKEQINEMREMLANSEWHDPYDDVWKNMPDEQIAENWENIYGEWED